MFRIRIRPLWNGGSCFECHSKSQWHVAEWQESLCRKIRTPQGTWSRTWWKSSQIHQCLHQEHQWWVRRNQTYRFVWKIWKNQLRQGNYTTWLNHSVETEEFSVTYQNVLEVKLWQKNSSFSTLCCIYVRFDHQMCPFSLGKFSGSMPSKALCPWKFKHGGRHTSFVNKDIYFLGICHWSHPMQLKPEPVGIAEHCESKMKINSFWIFL